MSTAIKSIKWNKQLPALLSIKIYIGIARFLRDSTAFLFFLRLLGGLYHKRKSTHDAVDSATQTLNLMLSLTLNAECEELNQRSV